MKKSIIALVLSAMYLSLYAQESDTYPMSFSLLKIVTVNGEMPSATVVSPPENGVGVGIQSEYVPGCMTVDLNGGKVYDSGVYQKNVSGMRIKIRGNSTGAYMNQHPYKIKLTKKADLLTFDGDYKNKNWALLSMYTWNTSMKNSESNILTLAGLAVCNAIGFPWTPRTRFANVVLNDKYQGLYHLIETVEKDKKRIDIDDTGFIIENDAYWWNENGEYFKTDRQAKAMGYTFKYPEYGEMTENTRQAIKDYMNTVENAVYTQTGIENYIDYTSFAKWILVHDILGSEDFCGSNMFLYKETFGEKAPFQSKLMMGTPWDFDSTFKVDDNSWSNQHTSDIFFYPQLFKDEKFRTEYRRLYNEKKNEVYPYVEKYFADLKGNYGNAFEQSRDLHRKVYENECRNSLDEQIDDVLSHLKNRLESLKNLMTEFDTDAGIERVAAKPCSLLKRFNADGIDVTGLDETSLPCGLYVEIYSDGITRKIFK